MVITKRNELGAVPWIYNSIQEVPLLKKNHFVSEYFANDEIVVPANEIKTIPAKKFGDWDFLVARSVDNELIDGVAYEKRMLSRTPADWENLYYIVEKRHFQIAPTVETIAVITGVIATKAPEFEDKTVCQLYNPDWFVDHIDEVIGKKEDYDTVRPIEHYIRILQFMYDNRSSDLGGNSKYAGKVPRWNDLPDYFRHAILSGAPDNFNNCFKSQMKMCEQYDDSIRPISYATRETC